MKMIEEPAARENSSLTVVTKETIEEFIKKNELSLVYCWHPKCTGCIDILPIIKEISEEYEGRCVFSTLNVDLNGSFDPELWEKYGINGTPTVLIILKGSLIAFFFMDSPLIPSAIRSVLENHFKTTS
jgi:thioredoxin-like negative regulator of GroEL